MMTTPSPHEVTQLLVAWSHGDRAALDKLTPLVYDELRRLAHHYMSKERPGHTLQTTALVNEAYLKLIDRSIPWQSREHFFAVSARVMRHILIDYARQRGYAKRGGGARQVSLEENDIAVMSDERAADLVALDEALDQLEEIDPQKSRIVELKYFGGLTVEEIASVLKVAPITIKRQWKSARAWLYHAINKSNPDEA